MISYRKRMIVAAVLMAGVVAAPVLADDSRAPVPGANEVKATRVQVEVNCQREGGNSYGTYGFGGYGCAKSNGARIDCKPDGSCRSNSAYRQAQKQSD